MLRKEKDGGALFLKIMVTMTPPPLTLQCVCSKQIKTRIGKQTKEKQRREVLLTRTS